MSPDGRPHLFHDSRLPPPFLHRYRHMLLGVGTRNTEELLLRARRCDLSSSTLCAIALVRHGHGKLDNFTNNVHKTSPKRVTQPPQPLLWTKMTLSDPRKNHTQLSASSVRQTPERRFLLPAVDADSVIKDRRVAGDRVDRAGARDVTSHAAQSEERFLGGVGGGGRRRRQRVDGE